MKTPRQLRKEIYDPNHHPRFDKIDMFFGCFYAFWAGFIVGFLIFLELLT